MGRTALDLSSAVWYIWYVQLLANCLDCSNSFSYQSTRTRQKGLGLWDCKTTSCTGEKVEKKRSATTCLLTQQVGFFLRIRGGCAGLFLWSVSQRWEVWRRLRGTHWICLDPIGMLWALKGQRGRTGASVSANLVGRWLTSPCPSKCDPGHTFNEIHSTWQAPPLPGLSV